MTQPLLWKASVTLSKSEAPDVAALFELTPPKAQAVLIAEEPFKDEATVEALYGVMPDGDLLSQLTGREVRVIILPDQDWIKLSHEGLPPVRAGHFFVYGAHDAGQVPPGVVAIRIEAGMAFGTGHHETTALCLSAIDDLARRRRYKNLLDLGCGTGVLAIAASKRWRTRVIASDIDPIATSVARENIRDNGEGPHIEVATAEGLSHPALARRAPFDLIIANILAGPLTYLAPQIAGVLAPGGNLILSGLLTWQENLVLGFYRPHGIVLRTRRRDGPWSALILERVGRAG
jgi:ribosomal protein L11 methyltransferase